MKSESDTEVWGGYFTDTGLFNVQTIEPDEPELIRPDIRLTLDYPEDYELFKRIFDRLYKPDTVFSLKEIVALFNENPKLLEINRDVHQQYLKGIQKKVRKIR
jgi:spore coat polysaccharide biosynthesis protein SpsF